MSALLIALIAAAAAGWAGAWAHRYRRDRADEAWADEWITQLRAMRGVARWPAGDDDVDDRTAQAEGLTMCELDQHRLDRAVRRHPAGGAR